MDRELWLDEIDDWELYGKALECVLGRLDEQLSVIIENMSEAVLPFEYEVYLEDLRRLRSYDRAILRQCADRAKRLRDRAVGLTNGKLDPEHP